MPVDRLPLMLEDLLNNILENNCVSSWNIHGANNYTQVTVRFKVETDENDEQQPATYRKVPPSRAARDKSRASNFRSTLSKDSENSGGRIANIPNKHSNVGGASYKPSTAISNINNTETNMQQGIMTNKPLQTGSNVNPAYSKHGVASSHKVNTSEGAVHENNSINVEGDYFQNQVMGKNQFETEDNGSSSDDFDVTQCGICQSGITSYKYHRCTFCTEEVDICDSCFLENQHSIHKKYIQTFTLNPDCLDDPKIIFCDSCGQVFPINDETMVWDCKICGDYCICEKCRFQDMHYVHKDDFKMIFIKAYIASL